MNCLMHRAPDIFSPCTCMAAKWSFRGSFFYSSFVR